MTNCANLGTPLKFRALHDDQDTKYIYQQWIKGSGLCVNRDSKLELSNFPSEFSKDVTLQISTFQFV